MKRSHPALHLAILATLLIETGCGAAPGGVHPAVSIRDSAGVRIVESAAPRWRAGEGWRIAETPRFIIGDRDGDPRYELYGVADVIRLSDGRSVIANGGTAQFRLYSARGEHLRDVGGRGAGPGEFRWIHKVWRAPGDSVMVYDATQQRVSVFAPRGDFARSFQLEMLPAYGAPSIVDRFADGSLISMGSPELRVPAAGGFVASSMLPDGTGVIDGVTWTFTRYRPDGGFLNEIGKLRDGARWSGSRAFLPLTAGGPFVAAGEEILHLGNGSAFEVEVRTSAGELTHLLRWNSQHRAVTRDDVARFRTVTLQRIRDENQRRRRERQLDETPYPEQMSAYQGLLVDALGHLWVEQYRPPWEERPRWWIFDLDGSWLGELETPAGFALREVGRDYILAAGHHEDDVELVALFPLER